MKVPVHGPIVARFRGVAQVREAQLRLIYSLLKPVVRVASRFHVPMRTLAELVRLAYFEHLEHEGLTQAEIARRLGQTDRHMRSLARKLRADFFAAEHEVGIVREVENAVAARRPRREEVRLAFPNVAAPELDHALIVLEAEGRIELSPDGRLQAPARYHVLSSDKFHHRIDALNHFLGGMYSAVLHRLVFDERAGSMIKAITFSALPDSLNAFLLRFEGDLRREIATLEEEAQFAGQNDARYTLGMSVAPNDEG
jgi:hypothetical protein